MLEEMKDQDESEMRTPASSGSETPIDGQSITTPTRTSPRESLPTLAPSFSSGSTSNRQVFNKTNRLPPFTIPEFKYSPMHIRLLNDVFDAIEVDVRSWRWFVSPLARRRS